MGGDWVVCDEGLSHNGTFVNGERVRGRRRLRGGDVIAVGDTLIAFCAPAERLDRRRPRAAGVPASPSTSPPPSAACSRRSAARSPARPTPRRPPTSRSRTSSCCRVETVKGTLKALFERFGLEALPQNQKRAALAARALALLRDADQR